MVHKWKIDKDRVRGGDCMEEKRCSKCKQWLPKEDFNKKQSAKDGLQSTCRYCKKIDSIERKLKKKDDKPKKEDFMKQGSKVCSKCKKEKSYDEFHLYYEKRRKKYIYKSACRECANNIVSEIVKNKRIETIQSINKKRGIIDEK